MRFFKLIIISILVVFIQVQKGSASELDLCTEEIAVATVEIAQTKAMVTTLISKMEKMDAQLEKHINEIDKRIISSLDENFNQEKAVTTLQSAQENVSKVVETHDIAAKARLIYLKAVILRYQFYASKIIAKDLAKIKGQ